MEDRGSVGPPRGEDPLAPRDPAGILSTAFGLYRQYFGTLLVIAAIVVVPLTLVQFFLGQQLIRETLKLELEQSRDIQTVPQSFWRVIAAAIAVALLGFLIGQILQGAMTRAATGALLGEPPSVGDAYRVGYRRLGSILLAGVLGAVAAFAGFLLLIIPGIFVLVRLLVSIPAVVVERRTGGQAVARSWSLVRGHWFHAFGAFAVATIITSVLSALLTAPFSGVFEGIAAAVAATLALPYGTLVVVLIYLDLRVKKEGLTAETLRGELQAAAG